MTRFLVIGGAGLLGAEVVKALGAGQCVVASRHAGERVDIANPKSLAALFDRVGEVDGIVCTGGAARFKPWDHLTDDDWAFSLANKLMGQINVVRLGANHVRHGGTITLTSGLAAQYPAPGSAIITTVNAAVASSCRRASDDDPARKRGLAWLGRRDAASYGARSGGRNSGEGCRAGLRAPLARGRVGLGRAGGETLNPPEPPSLRRRIRVNEALAEEGAVVFSKARELA